MKITSIKSLILLLGIAVSLTTLNSCLGSDDYDDQGSIDDEIIQNYLEENGIDATKNALGFYYSVVEANESGAEVEEDDILSVYYEINVLNGEKIDEVTEGSGNPKRIKIVNNSIFPQGVLLGLSLMKEGEKFKFYLPSSLGYGSYNYTTLIPSNAILIVEGKIAKIENEDDQKQYEKTAIETYITDNSITNFVESDSGVFYKKTDEGTGDSFPLIGEEVEIKYVAKYIDGTEFSKTETDDTFNFILGSDSIIKGLQEGIKLMKKGEKATLIIPSHLAYSSSLQIFPEEVRDDMFEKGLITQKIPSFMNLIFEVELVEFN